MPLATRAEVAAYRERESKWNARHQAAQQQLNVWLGEKKKRYAAELRGAKIDALAISDAEKKVLTKILA